VLSLVGNIIGFVTKVLPMLLAWRAGKNAAEKAVLEQETNIVEKSNEVERELDQLSDDSITQRLRKRWVKQK
jgi:hypothetical protein|tara:strand:- start:66 stop:281 length:216 start_codon:yes stop_codon:yes gene_type:complete